MDEGKIQSDLSIHNEIYKKQIIFLTKEKTQNFTNWCNDGISMHWWIATKCKDEEAFLIEKFASI